ncbi:MAG: HAD family hydrolase, partial [Clostridia bacterium]|nr:HAD family hydrolase [Clostridia bacterium]
EEKVTEVLAFYRQMYDKVYMETKTTYEGIPEVFSALHERGYLLAILSNKPDAYMPPLAKALLPDGTYQISRGQRPGVAAKPDPNCVFTLTDELGVLPSECAFVGDSNVDMQTAKNAGLLAVGVTWGYRSEEILRDAGADLVVHQPPELLELFK